MWRAESHLISNRYRRAASAPGVPSCVVSERHRRQPSQRFCRPIWIMDNTGTHKVMAARKTRLGPAISRVHFTHSARVGYLQPGRETLCRSDRQMRPSWKPYCRASTRVAEAMLEYLDHGIPPQTLRSGLRMRSHPRKGPARFQRISNSDTRVRYRVPSRSVIECKALAKMQKHRGKPLLINC